MNTDKKYLGEEHAWTYQQTKNEMNEIKNCKKRK